MCNYMCVNQGTDMTVIVTNSYGIWTFPSYRDAADFRAQFVFALSEPAFHLALEQNPKFQFSDLAIYKGE